MNQVYRIYVEKMKDYAAQADSVFSDLKENLKLEGLKSLRLINRYDVQGLSKDDFDKARDIVFSEPQVDVTYEELPQGEFVFAVEYLPGQFDQRADSCAHCISLLTGKEPPIVRSATVYILSGDIKGKEEQIKAYLINPVESREASLAIAEDLQQNFETPTTVETLDGFIALDRNGLADFVEKYALAMDIDDIEFCQNYFKNDEKRDPTISEIRMIDTYWSDHCRHTTFLTQIENVDIEPDYVKEVYDAYLQLRNPVKPQCLMDMAVFAAKHLKKQGLLNDLDESEEINACSVKVTIEVDGEPQQWLLMFKNETHNHPTEIEPFGGAATCLGGAIRDPLSGRSYVYQAMRITGASDPRKTVEETIPGKLPQRKITLGAASGYSSYGNQIGLATGFVKELYHDGYTAKRMEIGAVMGAAPCENVVRLVPSPGDVVILLGGATGRDGCGGATGSSKSHTKESITTCGAEVQKGNAPEERKLQRLFRNPEATKLIKRCNDFGAGGVSVAIGELADGLLINLNAVPKKYEGLTGTELAISESQERMAVVIAAEDVDKFISLANSENLNAQQVAVVTEEPRLEMEFYGKRIVSISREFLNSNGAEKHTSVKVPARDIENILTPELPEGNLSEKWLKTLEKLNVCSQRGLVERFDSTIGAGTVLMPYGGKYMQTESQYMAAKLPVLNGTTDDCSMMAYGFDPVLSSKSPFHGAAFAVVESVSKLVAAGGNLDKMWLTFQEYFPRTKNDPERWGLPFEALLGSIQAQLGLSLGSIGGKDSMSGTFEDIDVPPTLTSFAVSVYKASKIVTNDFKKAGSKVYLLRAPLDKNSLPEYSKLKEMYRELKALIDDGKILSTFALTSGGLCEAISKMSFGNKIGFEGNINEKDIFDSLFGSIVIESDAELSFELIGKTIDKLVILVNGCEIDLNNACDVWCKPLEKVFPTKAKTEPKLVEAISFNGRSAQSPAIKCAKPTVVIPVFPGTNCEYDTARAFEKAGAQAKIIVIRNRNEADISDSVEELYKAISQAQIVMLPGGFSGGDEPDGSGKFIATFFRNEKISYAVSELLESRDGLMLGICNGFQALIKLGLVPFGKIVPMTDKCPTLTFNEISRHQSAIVRTRVSSTLSPWLSGVNVGDVFEVPISHGEGRFVANDEVLAALKANGQIATQYVDLNGNPTMDIFHNPNASMLAIEGITSADGRVFGKMGHSERTGANLYRNIYGNFDIKIFESGVKYFK